MSDSYEVIATVAKEILIKAMDVSSHLNIFMKDNDYPKGVDLANHLGDCYKALHKKVGQAIRGE